MNIKKIKNRIVQLFILIEYVIILCYCKLFRINNEDVWLISERGDEARDNGYAFYKYMKEKHPEINAKYIISKHSDDIRKIEDKKDIIYLRSIKHFILFITSGKLISSHLMGYSPEMRVFNKLDSKFKLHIRGKKVFLQHGIIKDKISIISPKNINLDMFVCGAEPEYNFLLETSGFKEDVLKYTGLPRYDNLMNNKKNYILVMPTWRTSLFYCDSVEKFKDSDYYKNWYNFLNNKKLHEELEKNNLKLLFYPHYELQPFIEAFKLNNDNIIMADKSKYEVQQLLNECLAMITDFSSVYFDIGYLRKPVIYFQFDYDDYRKTHYQEGWFNYKKDGFGPVTMNSNDTVKCLIKYINNNYKIEKKFQDNINSVFSRTDHNNSQRVYEEIIKL